MALLATQQVGYAGVNPALAAATGGGDTFTPSNNLFLYINNAGGGSITVTVTTPQTLRGQAVSDLSVSVTNGQARFIRISPADFFTDPATGLGSISYTGVTSVTVGVFQVQDA